MRPSRSIDGSRRAPVRHDWVLLNEVGERRTRVVVVLTFLMMVAEIGAGWAFGSMALVADGWHMGSHAAALFITLFAYYLARRFKDDPRFSFGTGRAFAFQRPIQLILGIAMRGCIREESEVCRAVFELHTRYVDPKWKC